MKIQITQPDIDRGGTGAANCPITLAIERTFDVKCITSFGYCTILEKIERPWKIKHYKLNESGIEFICRLCRGDKLVPTEIEITES